MAATPCMHKVFVLWGRLLYEVHQSDQQLNIALVELQFDGLIGHVPKTCCVSYIE